LLVFNFLLLNSLISVSDFIFSARAPQSAKVLERFIFRRTANSAELQADQQCPLGCSPQRAEPQNNRRQKGEKTKWHTNT
jgi:hypothetical protein